MKSDRLPKHELVLHAALIITWALYNVKSLYIRYEKTRWVFLLSEGSYNFQSPDKCFLLLIYYPTFSI